MNWEDSNACTPIKRDFLRAWFAEEHRFFLTGGSALGLFYLHHRRSYDLDLFSSEVVEGKEVQNAVQRIAGQIGAQCESLRTAAWMIRPLGVADLQAFVDRLRLALAERAIPGFSP